MHNAGPAPVIPTRDDLVARLVSAGELEVSGGDQGEIDSYFNTSAFRFHGPGGFEADYAGLTSYFQSIRAAFDDRSIRRGIIVAEGAYVACQTWIEGTFVREFTMSPAGPLPPIRKGEIGGDQQRRVLVELADQVEQQLAAGLAERQIAEFVDDDDIVAQ